jgi:peptidoglycan/xylan/chitin deacetylase (PgdA/CDA1 family)
MDRTTLATAMEDVGIPSLLLSLRGRAPSPWIPVLTYHRCAPVSAAADFDDGVVDVTPEAFDRQMAYVTKWFDVVGIDELLEFRRGGPLPNNPLLITFDDGYLDNHDVALPILKKHGTKAVFFMATHYLSERRLFWWDKINWLMKRSTRETIELAYPAPERLELGPTALQKKRAIKRVLRIVKDHHGLDLPRFIESLSASCGVSMSSEEERIIANSLLMTWDQVKELRRQGMDVQSHTSTHRVLQTLRDDQLAEELGGSREILEGIMGEKIRAISYPVGKPLKYTPGIRNAVRKAGYELGFSNGTGINHRWDFDPLDAKRISLDADVSDSMFHAMCALPYLAP